MVVGPPGTGKTDTAVQIMHVLYHNCPGQRTLLITHSNQALNDLFEKILERDVPARYVTGPTSRFALLRSWLKCGTHCCSMTTLPMVRHDDQSNKSATWDMCGKCYVIDILTPRWSTVAKVQLQVQFQMQTQV